MDIDKTLPKTSTTHWIVAAAVLAIYGGLTIFALHGDGIAPAWSDEFVYHQSARSFAQNGVMQESILLSESTARWWGLGSHGFAYTLVDGWAYRLFGDSLHTKLVLNALFLLTAATLLLATSKRKPSESRWASLLILLTTFVVPTYAFTYMQEVGHLTVAVVLWIVLRWIARSPERTLPVGVFFIAVMVASLARPSWVLALFALLAFAQSKKEIAVYSIVAVVGLFVIAGTMPLFYAPYPFGFLPNALKAVAVEGWGGFAWRVAENVALNLRRYFGISGSPSVAYFAAKYLFAIATAWVLIRGFRTNHRLAIVVGLMAAFQWLALCFFYDAFNWREQRMLAPLGLIVCLAIVHGWPGRPTTVLLAASLLIWIGGVFRNAIPMIDEHRMAAIELANNPSEALDVARIADAIECDSPTTVLLPFGSFSRPAFILGLPVRSRLGFPIRYTMNLDGDEFARFGKIAVGYAVVPPTSPKPTGKKEWQNASFTLVEFPCLTAAEVATSKR